jgi:hypothetical protein
MQGNGPPLSALVGLGCKVWLHKCQENLRKNAEAEWRATGEAASGNDHRGPQCDGMRPNEEHCSAAVVRIMLTL